MYFWGGGSQSPFLYLKSSPLGIKTLFELPLLNSSAHFIKNKSKFEPAMSWIRQGVFERWREMNSKQHLEALQNQKKKISIKINSICAPGKNLFPVWALPCCHFLAKDSTAASFQSYHHQNSAWPLANKHHNLFKLSIPVLSLLDFYPLCVLAPFICLPSRHLTFFWAFCHLFDFGFFKHFQPRHVSSSQGVPGCQNELCKIFSGLINPWLQLTAVP